MVYMGSKNRISKDLLKIIEPYLSPDKNYYEPFVGGANFIDKIPKDKCKRIIGNDYNKYLIALLNKMKDSPEDIKYEFIEKEDWYENYLYPFRKNELKLEDWEIGYLGFTKTFSGMFMRSYAGIFKKTKQNYQKNKHNNIIKQSQNLKYIKFIYGDYKDMDIENNSIIYIDGPYKNTGKYKVDINHEELYKWIEFLVYKKDCIVFISEYQMPDNYTCIWEKEIKNTIGSFKDKKTINIEKLFILEKKISK